MQFPQANALSRIGVLALTVFSTLGLAAAAQTAISPISQSFAPTQDSLDFDTTEGNGFSKNDAQETVLDTVLPERSSPGSSESRASGSSSLFMFSSPVSPAPDTLSPTQLDFFSSGSSEDNDFVPLSDPPASNEGEYVTVLPEGHTAPPVIEEISPTAQAPYPSNFSVIALVSLCFAGIVQLARLLLRSR